MDEKKETVSTVKQVSAQEKIIEQKVASSVLGQTSIFFISLVIIIGVLSYWFNLIMNKVIENGIAISKLESKIDSK